VIQMNNTRSPFLIGRNSSTHLRSIYDGSLEDLCSEKKQLSTRMDFEDFEVPFQFTMM